MRQFGIFVYYAFIVLPSVRSENVPEIIYKDEGQNVTLRCTSNNTDSNSSDTAWIVSDTNVGQKLRSQNSAVLNDGSLLISNLSSSDSHLYTCQDAETNQSLGSVKLIVRSVPPSVNNLTIITHSVYALVTWELHGDGGYPVNKFILKYRKVANNSNAEWEKFDSIKPNASSITVYRLEPNATYFFRIQAVNRLGAGHEVTVMASTKYDVKEIKQAKELQALDSEPPTNIYMK